MPKYTCNAKPDGKTACGKSCWGGTAYCLWHNAFLTWRTFAIMGNPLPRSFGWLPYDRNLLSDWTPPAFFATGAVATGAGLGLSYPLLLLYFDLAPPSDVLLQRWSVTLWTAAVILIAAMIAGNSHLALPKCLLVVACVVVALDLYRVMNVPQVSIRILPRNFALLLWSLPPPKGPLLNAAADVSDESHLPPYNAGSLLVKSAGVILLIAQAMLFLIPEGDHPSP